MVCFLPSLLLLLQEDSGDGKAWDTMVYSKEEVERIGRLAANMAMKRRKILTSVDKANVLACSRMWRKTMEELIAKEFPGTNR